MISVVFPLLIAVFLVWCSYWNIFYREYLLHDREKRHYVEDRELGIPNLEEPESESSITQRITGERTAIFGACLFLTLIGAGIIADFADDTGLTQEQTDALYFDSLPVSCLIAGVVIAIYSTIRLTGAHMQVGFLDRLRNKQPLKSEYYKSSLFMNALSALGSIASIIGLLLTWLE